MLYKTYITLKNLQFLIEFLLFVYKVISLKKIFIKKLLKAFSNIKGKILYLISNMRFDFKWWKEFLPK